jgi:hypothetical protein
MVHQHTLSSLPAKLGLGAAKHADARQPLRELRSALAEGWELVQPIFVRPQWSALDDGHMSLHCVLQRDHATRLVTLPETPATLRFIRKQSWRVQERLG